MGNKGKVNKKNNGTKESLNIICDRAKWEATLHKDIETFYSEDPTFRVCIVSQSSTQALSFESDLQTRFPQLKVKRLIGVDSGETKNSSLRTSTTACLTPTSSCTALS